MSLIIYIISSLAALIFMAVAIKHQLHMLQLSSYRNDRYLLWLRSRVGWATAIYIILILSVSLLGGTIAIISISAIVTALTIFTLRKRSKKALTFTARAKRIYATSFFIGLIPAIIIAIISKNTELAIRVSIAISLLAWAVLIAANTILHPLEKAINNWYIKDARRRLASMPNLKIIGITGSYGKTSTKHFLYRILSERYNTLMTPGSYNTTLGVVRTIREQLKPFHDIFIVEMGAKEIGDIKEICDIVHPEIAILTSIGEQHLESFKSIENIANTKFELIDSLPTKGLAVLNMDSEKIGDRDINPAISTIYYGSGGGIDLMMQDISYSSLGCKFSIYDRNKDSKVSFTTPILGEYNISNIIASYAVARYLEVPDIKIKSAIERLEAVEHRLQIRYAAAGVTIIDDAFNSNPKGAAMALDVLKEFAPQQRVLITPGLVELGDKQREHNFAFGNRAAHCADYVIVVGKYNRKAIGEGLASAGFPSNSLFYAQKLNDAVSHLAIKFSNGGYVVLYENDLPDTFK